MWSWSRPLRTWNGFEQLETASAVSVAEYRDLRTFEQEVLVEFCAKPVDSGSKSGHSIGDGVDRGAHETWPRKQTNKKDQIILYEYYKH